MSWIRGTGSVDRGISRLACMILTLLGASGLQRTNREYEMHWKEILAAIENAAIENAAIGNTKSSMRFKISSHVASDCVQTIDVGKLTLFRFSSNCFSNINVDCD